MCNKNTRGTGLLFALMLALALSVSACSQRQQEQQSDNGDDPGDEGGEVYGEEIDENTFRKDVVAIGFDIVGTRAVVGAGGAVEPGEPDNGPGRLSPPMGDNLDRPLPWALTPFGQRVWNGTVALAPDCGNLPGTLPQPAHGRWANPRQIVLQVPPGFNSVYVDDLDCSSGEVDIRKEVQLEVIKGQCAFVGPFPPSTREEVTFTEPKGWSIQPAPVVFGGRLIVPPPPARCELAVQVLKKAANWPDEEIVGNHYQKILVILESKDFQGGN